MAKYSDDFISFDLPRDWIDESVIAYAAPKREDGSRAGSVVMTREPFATSLKAFVERRLVAISSDSVGFVLREHREETLGGRPSVVVDYVTEHAVQRLAAIDLDGEKVIMLTLSTSHNDAESMEPLFARMLSSLEIA